jgi:putative copper export protein
MLPVTWSTVRVFLHVLAATVWVGGQLSLAVLVPVLRRAAAEASRAAARRFNAVAWPAFAVLVATGVWNVLAESEEVERRYATTLAVKVVVVVLSGAAAFAHTRARTRRGVAVYGGVSATAALAALFVGVLLAGAH